MALGQCAVWSVLLTLGTLPLAGVCLFSSGSSGSFGGSFVLTWPSARGDPPALAGTAVAVSNLGGFVGASFTQGPVGAVLDEGWTGAVLMARASTRWRPTGRLRALCALRAARSRDQLPPEGDAGREHPSPAPSCPPIRGNILSPIGLGEILSVFGGPNEIIGR